MRKLSYENRLDIFGVSSLEERRKRGDLIEIYKLYNELEILDPNCQPKFILPNTGPAGGGVKG